MEKAIQTIITCCPKCSEESFDVTVTDSGTGFDGERTTHWIEGDGKCLDCGYEGWLSDSD